MGVFAVGEVGEAEAEAQQEKRSTGAEGGCWETAREEPREKMFQDPSARGAGSLRRNRGKLAGQASRPGLGPVERATG